MNLREWESMSWDAKRRYNQRLARLRRDIPKQIPEVTRMEAQRLLVLIEPDPPAVIAARQELLQQITTPNRKRST